MLSRLSPTQRTKAVGGLAAAVIKLLGFTHAVATADASGKVLTVTVPKGEACVAGPAGGNQLTQKLKAALPFLTSVRASVADSGESFGAYAARCAVAKLPSANGKVLYARSGSGFDNTASFTVHSSRWTIAFANRDVFLQVFVVKGGKIQPETISSQARGTGKKAFKGPGTFALRVSGAGAWRLEVHDGA